MLREKRRFIIKQITRISSWVRVNVGIWGQSCRRHRGLGGGVLSSRQFLQSFNKNNTLLSIFGFKYLL